MAEASSCERLRRLSASAQAVRDHIMQSPGEAVPWRDVVDILDLVRELASIVGDVDRSVDQLHSVVYDITGG